MKRLIIFILIIFLMPYIVDAQGFGHCPFGNFPFGNCVITSKEEPSKGGGGDSGTSPLISQLKCDQLAIEYQQCLTYNPNTKQCDIGCNEGICGESYTCTSFIQNNTQLVPLNQIISSIKDKESCLKAKFIYFQDVCYECNGELVNYRGTVLCKQFLRKGIELDELDNDIIIIFIIAVGLIALAIDDSYKKQKLKKKQEELKILES